MRKQDQIYELLNDRFNTRLYSGVGFVGISYHRVMFRLLGGSLFGRMNIRMDDRLEEVR